MKNYLIVCNTYYQLLVAIQMKETLFLNDNVSLVITDHSKNSRVVSQKLKSMAIFSDVYYVEVKSSDYSKLNLKSFLLTVMSGVFANNKTFKALSHLKIDEFIYNNLTFSTLDIFAILYKNNPGMVCSRMEEGVLAYDVFFHEGADKLTGRLAAITKIRKLLKKANIFTLLKRFYCFQPDFYKGCLKPVKIDSVSEKGKMKDILIRSFSVDLNEESYKEKYIFFTSVYDFEGGEPIGEYELVCKIADLVGKENLLVKTHPRDVRTIYEDNGFTVDKNSDVPWEAIQLSRDFSDKVFLTATSGSVLAGSFMSENPPKTFFMHKCCNILDNKPAQKSVETIEELLNDAALKETLKTVSIVNDIKDILV